MKKMPKPPVFAVIAAAAVTLFANVVTLFADVVTLKDGRQLVGATTGTARQINIKTPSGEQSVDTEQVQSIRFDQTNALPAASAFQSITLPADTRIIVRTIDAIDSKTGKTDRDYAASLADAVVVNGVTVIPAKVSAVLRIRQIQQAGRLKGSTTLSLRLTAVALNGKNVGLETDDVVSQSDGKGRTTIKDAAIGSGAGCVIGAVVGGLFGCEVGGMVGGAVGSVKSALTEKTVKIPTEMQMTFRLSQPAAVPIAAAAAITDPLPSGGAETPLAAAIGRGQKYAGNGQFAEALAEYRKALEINERSSLAHYRTAQVFVRQQNLQAAANEFRLSLNGDLDPGWVVVWTHINLGQIFDGTGQRERAINEYLQAARTSDNTDGAQDLTARYLKDPYRPASQ